MSSDMGRDGGPMTSVHPVPVSKPGSATYWGWGLGAHTSAVPSMVMVGPSVQPAALEKSTSIGLGLGMGPKVSAGPLPEPVPGWIDTTPGVRLHAPAVNSGSTRMLGGLNSPSKMIRTRICPVPVTPRTSAT